MIYTYRHYNNIHVGAELRWRTSLPHEDLLSISKCYCYCYCLIDKTSYELCVSHFAQLLVDEGYCMSQPALCICTNNSWVWAPDKRTPHLPIPAIKWKNLTPSSKEARKQAGASALWRRKPGFRGGRRDGWNCLTSPITCSYLRILPSGQRRSVINMNSFSLTSVQLLALKKLLK